MSAAAGSWRRVGRWLLATCAAIACAWWFAATRNTPTPPSNAAPGQNLLSGVIARDSVTPALTELRWEDMAATAAGTSARAGLRRDVIDTLASQPRVEARYFRGLLFMAEQRPEEALAAFEAIPVDRIPALHLYAPYRLHGTLRPGRPNPYRAGLVAARRAGQLPPLIAARIAAAEGDMKAAVASYVTSDPAQWARHDLGAFRALLLHAGLSPDTRTMLLAALRGGRVPGSIKGDVQGLLESTRASAPPDEVRAALKRLLRENPVARDVAVAAASEQLRVRRLFLARQYAQLVREHRASDRTSLPDATLVIVLVSANETGDRDLRDLYAQELRRRHPDGDVDRFLASVKSERS